MERLDIKLGCPGLTFIVGKSSLFFQPKKSNKEWGEIFKPLLDRLLLSLEKGTPLYLEQRIDDGSYVVLKRQDDTLAISVVSRNEYILTGKVHAGLVAQIKEAYTMIERHCKA